MYDCRSVMEENEELLEIIIVIYLSLGGASLSSPLLTG